MVCSMLLLGCGGNDAVLEGVTTAAVASEPVVPCLGEPGRLSESSSYRPAAPDVASDGSEVEVRLTVLDGACRPVVDAVVEIWHTGDSSEYSDTKWRTARMTDENGAVSYTSVLPRPGEGPSHFHVRVSAQGFPFEFKEWVLMTGDMVGGTPRLLERRLLLVHALPGELSGSGV